MNRQRRKALQDIIDQLETLRMQLETQKWTTTKKL